MFEPLKIKEKDACKCLLVGDGCTGKTTFMRRHLTGAFEKAYKPTKGLDVHPIAIHTDRGTVYFQVWDTAGHEQYCGLGNGYYFFADCAIIMFDFGSRESCRNVRKWRHEIEQICGSQLPVAVCGNKVDLNPPKIKTNAIRARNSENLQYFVISTKANFNIDLPFSWLCKRILNCNKLCLIAQPKMHPSDVQITKEQCEQIHNELAALKKISHEIDNKYFLDKTDTHIYFIY